MAAKIVAVSSDDATYYTLPGNTGQLSNEAGALDDTVFGQAFKSMQSSLINWSVSAQAFYKGFAGYVATLNISGTPTALTAEACTLVSGKTYQITNTAHRILDPTTAITIKDGATDHTADVLNIDYLNGTVTFKAAYTPTGAITFATGKYLPMTAITSANNFTITQSADVVDISDYDSCRTNSGYRLFSGSLKTCSIELKGFYDSVMAWKGKLETRGIVVVEISPPGDNSSVCRGFYKVATDSLSGNVGAPEEESVKLNLFVPDPGNAPLLLSPFTWTHTSSTLNLGVIAVLNAFINGTSLFVRYLPDGVNGFKGSTVIKDCTLTNGVDAMNSFAVNLQGTNAPVAYP